MSTEPCASSTARDVKFSDAISWIVVFWRSTSRRMMSAISGIGLLQRATSSTRLLGLDCGDLLDAAHVPAALERRVEEDARRSPRRAPARRCARRSTGRWRRCAARPCARCRGRCTARRGRRAPCWPRSARPGRCRRARCPASAPPARDRAADGRAVDRVVDRLLGVRCRGRRRRGPTPSAPDEVLLERVARRGRRRSRCAPGRVYRPDPGDSGRFAGPVPPRRYRAMRGSGAADCRA